MSKLLVFVWKLPLFVHLIIEKFGWVLVKTTDDEDGHLVGFNWRRHIHL